jgi:hypothetical protein
MARKKTQNDNFADLVARLKEMSNMTPEQERTELMEAASHEPKILDEKDVTLADIAKLAGIKEYEEPKISKEAEKLVESITAEQPKVESDITKAIKESDADTSIASTIKKEVTEEAKRLDKIAELESQLAELKAEEKQDATMDLDEFRTRFVEEITEFVKEAESNDLVDLYNRFSANEVDMNEDSFIIKTPETKEIIADAEKAEAPEEEVLADAESDKRNMQEPHKGEEKADDKEAEDKSDEKDDEGEVPMLDPEFDEGEEVELPVQDKFTNDLDKNEK